MVAGIAALLALLLLFLVMMTMTMILLVLLMLLLMMLSLLLKLLVLGLPLLLLLHLLLIMVLSIASMGPKIVDDLGKESDRGRGSRARRDQDRVSEAPQFSAGLVLRAGTTVAATAAFNQPAAAMVVMIWLFCQSEAVLAVVVGILQDRGEKMLRTTQRAETTNFATSLTNR